jgi:hypothetical protein
MRSTILVVLAVALPVAALAAAPFEAPKRKSGLWETTMSFAGQPGGMTMKQCIDQKSDDLMRSQARDAQADIDKQCSKRDWKQVSGGYEFDTVCTFGGTTHKSKGKVTGSMDTGYKMVIDTQYDPPMQGMSTNHMEMEAKWTGACPADMRPGDVIMPGGHRMNIEDMKGMRPPTSRPPSK